MSFMLLGILNSQVSGGGAGAFDLLETTTLTSSAASVTFSGLDAYSDYKHLQLRMVTRLNYASTGLANLDLTFNSDTAANYKNHFLRGTGSVVESAAQSYSAIRFGQAATYSSSTANSFGASVIDILDFSSSNKNTTARNLSGALVSGQTSIRLESGLWINTNAGRHSILNIISVYATVI